MRGLFTSTAPTLEKEGVLGSNGGTIFQGEIKGCEEVMKAISFLCRGSGK